MPHTKMQKLLNNQGAATPVTLQGGVNPQEVLPETLLRICSTDAPVRSEIPFMAAASQDAYRRDIVD
ncbi:hypothetical protein D3C78_1260990 [compost metagenome]